MLNKYLFVLPFLWINVLNAQSDQLQDQFPHSVIRYGGIERLDSTQKQIYLTFTGGDFNDGRKRVPRYLKQKGVIAQFFFTGDFYRHPENKKLIQKLRRRGHYLGAHSDKHLLYATWENRDSLLVDRSTFEKDLLANYEAMSPFGIKKEAAYFFMPPYEWYNSQISEWTAALGFQLLNFTPGTRSNADYTTPDMGDRYYTSDFLYQSILDFEKNSPNGLNGFILLVHIGTHPSRVDKLYDLLPGLIDELRNRGYQFVRLKHP